MPKKKPKTQHAEIVIRFAARLRELRISRGLTQAELARAAHVTATYIWRLESSGAAPGIDLLERLASALGTSVHELLPTAETPDALPLLQQRARKLFDDLLISSSREDLLMLCPLLARLGESPTRRR
jgi:transcriptional regulator with XRE-family HTH domain